jgi:hypothetical protein
LGRVCPYFAAQNVRISRRGQYQSAYVPSQQPSSLAALCAENEELNKQLRFSRMATSAKNGSVYCADGVLPKGREPRILMALGILTV